MAPTGREIGIAAFIGEGGRPFPSSEGPDHGPQHPRAGIPPRMALNRPPNPRAARRLHPVLGFLAVVVFAGGCQSAVDTEYDQVWAAAKQVMETDGPWMPEFHGERTIFLRPGTGMYFRGLREPKRIGRGGGWDWEGYSLGKDSAGTEVWFWSSTRVEATRKTERAAETAWGLTLVAHDDGGSTVGAEAEITPFEVEPRAARGRTSDEYFVRVLSRAPGDTPYWDNAVIVWTRLAQTVQEAEKPFSAAQVRRDRKTGEVQLGRVEVSLGEVVGYPDWEAGRRLQF